MGDWDVPFGKKQKGVQGNEYLKRCCPRAISTFKKGTCKHLQSKCTEATNSRRKVVS